MKLVITGTTGMVGEGVLLACLDDPSVEKVLAVSRRPCGHAHAKLEELLVKDFRKLTSEEEAKLAGYDACFYCAGVSSVGMKEPEYTQHTLDTPIAFAEALLRQSPGMLLTHVSGAHTDGTEQGRVMWARVKGRAENTLAKMAFRAVYNFRPGLMKPVAGQKNLKGVYRAFLPLFPVAKLFFPALTLDEVAKAMRRCVTDGAPKTVLEVADIRALAEA